MQNENKDETEVTEETISTNSVEETPVPDPTPPSQPAPEPPNPPQEEEEPQNPLPEPPTPSQVVTDESHSTDKQIERDKPEPTPSVVDTPPVAPTTPPQVAPTPSQVVTDEPVLRDTPLAPGKPTQDEPKQPALATKPEPKLTPEQKAMQLTEEELDAARKLWAKNHLSEAQKKSNESRHKRMLERMDELEKLVKSGDSTLQELSNKMNLSEKLTSSYLQKLVKAGRIKATGNTNNRRFS